MGLSTIIAKQDSQYDSNWDYYAECCLCWESIFAMTLSIMTFIKRLERFDKLECFKGCHDIQHNNTQHGGSQHNNNKVRCSAWQQSRRLCKMLFMLSVIWCHDTQHNEKHSSKCLKGLTRWSVLKGAMTTSITTHSMAVLSTIIAKHDVVHDSTRDCYVECSLYWVSFGAMTLSITNDIHQNAWKVWQTGVF